jgi:uroporphyrinogen III methyltransferase / synthase
MFSILLPPAYDRIQFQPPGDLRLLHWPTLEVHEPESFHPLDEAIDNLFGYDWLLIKNEHAAEYFLRRFEENHTADELDQIRVLAIGDAAAERLARSQIHVDLPLDRFPVPDSVVALEAYAGQVTGLNVLAPSAGVIRETFEEQLNDRGARIDNVTAYRTVTEKARLVELNTLLIGGGIDSIAFAGPADIDQFARVIDSDDLRRLLSGVLISCGGEETAAAAVRYGLAPAVVAPTGEKDALIKALDPFR